MDDSSILWGANTGGILAKLPTREGQLDIGQARDALETYSGLVLARVGSVGDIPPALTNLAARVIETGAAAMIEISDFPEQSTDANSLGQVLLRRYEVMVDALVAGVEALGGEPDIMQAPAVSFPAPRFPDRRVF